MARQIVVLKLGSLSPELQAIAPGSVLALTPRRFNQVLTGLTCKGVRRPVYPLGAGMNWPPASPPGHPPAGR